MALSTQPGQGAEGTSKNCAQNMGAKFSETRAMASQPQHPESGDASHLISLILHFYVCKAERKCLLSSLGTYSKSTSTKHFDPVARY